MTFHAETDSTHRADLPDLMELAARGAHAGWLVLDAARVSKFTGEIAFRTEPEIRVYFDNGLAYYAVRDGDPSLCRQMLEAAVIEPAQIERGVVRVGTIEHLGRLFDRDPSVDRDAVMVFSEHVAESVLTDLANSRTSTFGVTAYRHHSSGIHRWFVAPSDPSQLSPIGHVAQIDSSVTSDLPSLVLAESDAIDLRIEWDQPNIHLEQPGDDDDAAAAAAETSALESILDGDAPGPSGDLTFESGDPGSADQTMAMLDLEPEGAPLLGIDEFVVSPLVDSATEADEEPTPITVFDEEFQIVWPDGTEQILASASEEQREILLADPAVLDDALGDEAEPLTEAPTHEAPAAEAPVAEAFAAPPAADADTPAPILPSSLSLDDVDAAADAVAVPDLPDMSLLPDLPAPVATDADAAPDRALIDLDAPYSAPDIAPDPEPTSSTLEVATDGVLRFEMPALVASADQTPDEHQPDEVVDAVRRALAAIEAAAIPHASLPPIIADAPDAPDAPEEVADTVDDAPFETVTGAVDEARFDVPGDPLHNARADRADLEAPLPAPVAQAGAFAPPTPDTSVDAIYSRASKSESAPPTTNAGPAAGVASVVFVDDDVDTEGGDRSGALRRLIGSLRRK